MNKFLGRINFSFKIALFYLQKIRFLLVSPWLPFSISGLLGADHLLLIVNDFIEYALSAPHTHYIVIYPKNSFLWYVKMYFGIWDTISQLFVLLTLLMIPLCMLAGRGLKNYVLYNWIFLFIEVAVIGVFTASHLLCFYVCFEVATILTFVVLIKWGYESRRSFASYYLFYFTFASSMLLLLGILLLEYQSGHNNLFLLIDVSLTLKQQQLFWWLFFFAFAVKVPMYPLHLWLPEAHVEAPTGGSILLAAILLKLGYYGFMRISVRLFFWGAYNALGILSVLAVIGMFHSMIVALRQIDAKRIIAYSSIAHMNYGLVGLFTWIPDGINGSIVLMLGHGLISAGLFLLIGYLYKRFGVRSIYYYGGLAYTMPLFSLFFFFFILFNIAFPLTINFFAEYCILVALLSKSKLILLLTIPSLVLNLINSLYLFVRICFGAPTSNISKTDDLLFSEWVYLFFLAVLVVAGGVSPYALMFHITWGSDELLGIL